MSVVIDDDKVETLAVEQREATSQVPRWRVDARFRELTVTAYDGPDFDMVRKRIGDMVLASDTTMCYVYRNRVLYRKVEIEREEAPRP